MNAVVSLCHFCEFHGPSVLLSSQACRAQNRSSSPQKQRFYGPPGCIPQSTSPKTSCEACQPLGNNIYITSDHDTETSFVSSQFPCQPETEALVRQACTRSLSCEVSPGKEGVLVFSDDSGLGGSSGCSVLSHTFLLRDCLARGFHRWFSITVLTKDRLLLLNMWPFLEKNISLFVSKLQISANKVYEVEQIARPQRSLRLSNAFCSDRSSRSLSELTGSPQVLAQLHLWFVWLLRNAATRFRETLPLVDSAIALEPIQEVEGRLTFVSAKNGLHHCGNNLDTDNSLKCLIKATGPSIRSLSSLRSLLGPFNFASVVFCLLVGRQVVVRGQPAVLVASILLTLKSLLPSGCVRLVPFSTNYLPLSECNMLGIDARAAVPQPTPQVARLEVLLPSESENSEPANITDVSKFSFHLKWPGDLPAKWPTFLSKLDRAMQSEFLSDKTLMLQIAALRMETLNAARVMHHIENQDKKTKQDSYDSRDKNALLQALGVNVSDADVLTFWSKSCLKM